MREIHATRQATSQPEAPQGTTTSQGTSNTVPKASSCRGQWGRCRGITWYNYTLRYGQDDKGVRKHFGMGIHQPHWHCSEGLSYYIQVHILTPYWVTSGLCSTTQGLYPHVVTRQRIQQRQARIHTRREKWGVDPGQLNILPQNTMGQLHVVWPQTPAEHHKPNFASRHHGPLLWRWNGCSSILVRMSDQDISLTCVL